MLTPIEFGLPPKFTSWRPGQLAAIDAILTSPERFICICAPTGFGKSLMYRAAAVMAGLRTVVCTSTKGLQDQLHIDFGQMPGTVDIRGQSNYPCKLAPKLLMPQYTTVEMGPCHSGVACDLKFAGGDDGCEYYTRYGAARKATCVNTNYALWMHDTFKSAQEDKFDGNLLSKAPVDMLVLDEAHDAVEVLAGFVGTEIGYRECITSKVNWPDYKDDEDKWREWGQTNNRKLLAHIEGAEEQIKFGRADHKFLREVLTWKRVQRKLERVGEMSGEWAIEVLPSTPWKKEVSVRFDPLWPAHYAESALFRQVKKVILVSATVRPKTAQLLGIPSQDLTFREYNSSFPVSSRPIIHVPTVQMNYRTEQDDSKVMWWLQRMDGIMDLRQDRKGVIHTVSYKRAELIRNNSRHASRMLYHNSQNRAEIVSQFKSSPPGTILLSPSVDTGYDFPYQECEYQIICKLPFADNRAKVVKARMKSDPEYSNYTTAQTIVQMTGRGMRAVDDRCETLIVDDSIRWFVGQNRRYFPKWWLESYVSEVQCPQPLPKL